jgi:NitT/TauT family transport system ATP-binding protein
MAAARMSAPADRRAPAGDALRVEHVTMQLAGRVVIADCTFTLQPGQLTALVGPSGCGKSTLGFLVAGYQTATAGLVRLGDQPVLGPAPERLMVFQETALMPWLTVAANVMFGPRARGAGRAQARRVADETLERVGLTEFADFYPAELSGGMQRRAELARALVNEPRVLILDEPFRGLDAMTRGLMQEYFARLWERTPATALFITTDIDEAILLADQLLIMTSAPGRVREVIAVDLPRPRRRAAVLLDQQAREIKQRALQALFGDALPPT